MNFHPKSSKRAKAGAYRGPAALAGLATLG
jgi:hypothetical protein